MTAVCLKPKTSTKNDTWSSVLTTFNTETASCSFIKNLTSTCISTVLYLRKIFPEDYFESKNFEGLSLKIFKQENNQNFPERIQQWLEGAFDAIDKKYLKNLMLDIQDAETNITLEIYTISFNYKQGNEVLNFLLSSRQTNKNCGFTESNTKLNTLNLLQMCSAVTRNSGNLPSQITLAMRLSYHENTPEDYQPKGYVAWKPQEFVYQNETRSIEIGVTETPHHYFKFINKSCLNGEFFENLENSELIGDSYPLIHQTNGTQQQKSQPQERQTKVKRELRFERSGANSLACLTPSPIFEAQDIYTSDLLQQSTSRRDNNKPDKTTTECARSRSTEDASKKLLRPNFRKQKTRCVCLCKEKSRTVVSCLSCKNLVHAECFGILQQEIAERMKFYCHLCHRPETRFKCHDKVLLSLKSSSDQQKLAVLRKVLRFCTRDYVSKITLKQIIKIAGSACHIKVVEIILNKMVEIGVAVPIKRRKTYLVDKDELTNKLGYYFYGILKPQQTQA